MKNILIIGPGKKFLSGISYYTICLANEFSKNENVSVVTLRDLVPKFLFPGSKRVGKEISNFKFDKKINVFDGVDWYWFPSIFRLPKYLKNNEVIILQWWTSACIHTYLLIKFLNIFYNKKIIFEMHEVLDVLESKILPLKIYSKIMSKLLFTKKETYVTHANSDKIQVIKNYNINPDRVFVVPLGSFDHHKKDIKNKKHSGINILFFGLLRPYKGVEYLIKAFNRIKNEKYNLIIAGEIWEGYKIKEIIEKSPKLKKITLIDKYVSDEEVNELFNKSDVLVLPYLRASQSGAAHIALSFGIPLIVSKVGGLKESMKEYNGSTFVKPKDVDGIKNAILSLKKGKRFDNPHPWSKTIKIYKRLIK
jgi:glycosyltransferase involved in cell wall biosynthesis